MQPILPIKEAELLIKFYFNLYPELIETTKPNLPKTFNRTLKVHIPKDIKADFTIRLAQEFAFSKWWWEGYTLYVPYHSNKEWISISDTIRKLGKEFKVRDLSFRGLKGKPATTYKEPKRSKSTKVKQASKPIIPDIYGVAIVKQLLVEFNYSEADLLTSVFDNESEMTEVISGNKELTGMHLQKLSKLFNLPISVFLPLDKTA